MVAQGDERGFFEFGKLTVGTIDSRSSWESSERSVFELCALGGRRLEQGHGVAQAFALEILSAHVCLERRGV